MALEVPFEGGCMCGALRYECTEAPAAVVCCHCTDCQRRTGSAFGISVIVPREAFNKASGKASSFASQRESGNVVNLKSCVVCGTRCWAEQEANPKFLVIIGGTLDDAATLQPNAHIYTATKQSWITFPEGVLTAEAEPDWREVFSV
ncbi:MAG: GFA family protein [Alphaproteobacteria bacterium]|nr:GFA family protein [Alphaproteobacteria bacterium]